MNTRQQRTNYFLALAFWAAGLVFLLAGVWNLIDCLAAHGPLTGPLVALFFLLLFAMVAVVYGTYLLQEARAGGPTPGTARIVERVHPARVVGLLAYGIIPLLFIYFSADNREFSSRREAAFAALRPAFQEFVQEHGEIPDDLGQLVPTYLPALPEGLVLDPDADPDIRVEYLPMNRSARLYYREVPLPGFENHWYYDLTTGRRWKRQDNGRR